MVLMAKMELSIMLLAVIAMSSLSKCEEYHQQLEDDFRFISHQDLMTHGSEKFTDGDVTSFGELYFDVARDQLFVGARDNLYRLSLRSFTILEKAYWPAPEDKMTLCQMKGQPEESCHNYIKVLLSDGNKLFTCGTNAFSPLCSWRELENVSSVTEWVKGLAKCPHNPNANVTALMTMTGEYYVGTATDFAGSDPAIYRALGSSSEGSYYSLRTNQYDSKWLNEPQFVGSFEDDKHVFFVFREAAVEYINCGKKIYSRIARVCKNDPGGQQIMLRETWTTFVKARLNCSIPGEYPFYYDEVQGVEYLPDKGLLYATFSTPQNSIAGSAVCVYNMSAIRDAFNGPFKHQENLGSSWESHHAHHQLHNLCQGSGSSTQQLAESFRYQLMNNAIQPATSKPLHTVNYERYTYLTATTVTMRDSQADVLFIATDKGYVKKLSVYENVNSACTIEIWKPELNNNISPIKTLRYLKETNSVYVGTEHAVIRVPAARCGRHSSRTSCLGAQDPMCGWEDSREACIEIPTGSYGYWIQDSPACPNMSMPVDGGWSSWSSWDVCLQKSEETLDDERNEDNKDKCLCQTRQCNNPAPKNGGKACEGSAIKVTNCTVHGGWTVWSGWSACSASCGVAIKWRRRTCSAPAPQHGGRLCVGPDRNEIYCTQTPPCPAPVQPVQEAGWSDWGQWSACSAPCGGGARWRKRNCDSPPPADGSPSCPGCDIEAEPCNVQACEHRHKSTTTDWISVFPKNDEGGYVEKRFKCNCKAQSHEPIKITVREEQRYCDGPGSCGIKPSMGAWSMWSDWDDCNVECGGGYQTSIRTCIKSPCEGSTKRQRTCNTHSCTTGWSCWGEWTQCSAACGIGQTKRTRSCILPDLCKGDAVQVKVCEGTECDGDTEWTLWSECDDNNYQYRCKKKYPDDDADPINCAGSNVESRVCNEFENDLVALPARRPETIHAYGRDVIPENKLTVASLSIFVALFFLIIIGLLVYIFKVNSKCTHKNRIPSSPHYITPSNGYVEIPLKKIKDRKPFVSENNKNFSGTMTLTKQTALINEKNHCNMTPKLYPKAMATEFEMSGTLKRNSHPVHGNVSCRNNLDFEQDKFY